MAQETRPAHFCGRHHERASHRYLQQRQPWHQTRRFDWGRFERYELAYQRHWSAEQILGYLYSTSYCSRQLLADRAPAFERDLRATLTTLNPADRFDDAVTLEAFFAWRR